MKRSILAVVLVFLIGPSMAQAQVGTAFTYQGRLTDGGSAPSGVYDFEFQVFTLAAGGTGSTVQTLGDVPVTNGLFTVTLDFGAAFTGSPRWLEVRVRPGASTGAYTALTPRQELTPTPNAVFSSSAASVTGVVPIANGGTGSATAAGALTALGAQPLVTGVCSAGSSIRVVNADGTVTCQADTNSGGTVTSVTAGTGLSGGAITTSGTIGVNFGGTGAAVSAARSDHNHTGTYLPATVSACPAGSSIQTINPDGTVVCQNDNAQPGFTLTTLDSAGTVGQYTSVTIGADGLGLISYQDQTNLDLKVAHCSNAACSTATTATLDSTGSVGAYTSVTIGADGLGLISYLDNTNFDGDLKVAHCSDALCSTATTATLDSLGQVGFYTSVTIGADGLGLISYQDQTNLDLKVAHCSNAACSTATTATLDSTGNVGYYTSVTIGADGLGLISYYDNTNGDLKVAHCSDTACSSATTATLDSTGFVGTYTAVTIGADGLGLISYYDVINGDLKVAHCSDTACSSASTVTLDSTASVGQYTSVTIGADGLGLISYRDNTNGGLKVAHCSNTACSSATTATLDSLGQVGLYTSVTIGADGLGLISYYDFTTNYDLKVAHCSNLLCQPYVRRR